MMDPTKRTAVLHGLSSTMGFPSSIAPRVHYPSLPSYPQCVRCPYYRCSSQHSPIDYQAIVLYRAGTARIWECTASPRSRGASARGPGSRARLTL
ncbi:hypothetical protein BGY98DRAFT_1046125, partial [Russula aff. rugulosa BPL654]